MIKYSVVKIINKLYYIHNIELYTAMKAKYCYMQCCGWISQTSEMKRLCTALFNLCQVCKHIKQTLFLVIWVLIICGREN